MCGARFGVEPPRWQWEAERPAGDKMDLRGIRGYGRPLKARESSKSGLSLACITSKACYF
jgi:hypothetical protein